MIHQNSIIINHGLHPNSECPCTVLTHVHVCHLHGCRTGILRVIYIYKKKYTWPSRFLVSCIQKHVHSAAKCTHLPSNPIIQGARSASSSGYIADGCIFQAGPPFLFRTCRLAVEPAWRGTKDQQDVSHLMFHHFCPQQKSHRSCVCWIFASFDCSSGFVVVFLSAV